MYESLDRDIQENYSERVSCLYSLAPIGINSHMVESLTSYISRLAIAHSVSTQRLIKVILVPHFDKSIFAAQRAYWGINDTGSIATSYIEALTKTTLREDLGGTTLNNWREFRGHSLLRRNRAWCPHCLQQWLEKKNEIYEPLIWLMNIIKVCPNHFVKLIENCPNCNEKLPLIQAKPSIGFCGKCKFWLGHSQAQIEVLTERDNHIIENIKSLLIHSKHDFSRGNISRILKKITEVGYSGNYREASRNLGFTTRVFYRWIYQLNPMPFENLLRISYLVNVPLINLLNGSGEISSNEFRTSTSYLEQRVKNRYNRDEVLEKLNKIIQSNEYPPPSVTEVSRRINVSTEYLYEHLNIQCKIISQQYLKYINVRTILRREELLKEIREIIVPEYERNGVILSHNSVRRSITSNCWNYIHEAYKKVVQELVDPRDY